MSAPPCPGRSSGPVLTAAHFGWLAIGIAAFAVYGSLLPFHFQPLPWGEAVARFHAVCSAPVRIESRSDWAANWLLFFPLGYCLLAALVLNRPARAGWLLAPLVLLACFVLSTALEFSQLFFPPRVSSLNDIVAQALGALSGVGLWLLVGRRLTAWASRIWAGTAGRNPVTQILAGYLVLLLLVQLLPLDLTLSPAAVYHKYKEGRVVLVPFTTPYANPWEMLPKNCLTLALYEPLISGHRHWFRRVEARIGFHSIPPSPSTWNAMERNGTQWNAMERNGTQWAAEGTARLRRRPRVGSYHLVVLTN